MLDARVIDKTIPIPFYYQLKTILLDEINRGEYPVGAMIPNENDISGIFSISRTTVRQAITELVQEGKLYRVKSKGTFVSKPKITQFVVNQNQRYDDHIRSTGRVPSTEILVKKIVPMPECLTELGCGDKTSKAFYLYRKRLADNEPVMRMFSYLPLDKCAFLLNIDFTKNSIPDVLKTNEDTRIHRITRTIEAIAAGPEDIRILDMEPGSPVQLITTIDYNSRNQAVCYTRSYYRGDQNKFFIEIAEK